MKHVKIFEDYQSDKREQFFQDCRKTKLTNEQLNFLKGKMRGTWSIDDKGLINVDGNFICIDSDITKLPVKFGKITGNFSLADCEYLTSLEGSPSEVGGLFTCIGCHALTSLKNAPETVREDFNCASCVCLTSLEGAPSEVGSDFSCYSCPSLVSLKGAPKKVRNFFCYDCKSLLSLKYAPYKTRGIYFNDSPNINPKEIKLYGEDEELFNKWLKSDHDVEDFIYTNRGALTGKKFGF